MGLRQRARLRRFATFLPPTALPRIPPVSNQRERTSWSLAGKPLRGPLPSSRPGGERARGHSAASLAGTCAADEAGSGRGSGGGTHAPWALADERQQRARRLLRLRPENPFRRRSRWRLAGVERLGSPRPRGTAHRRAELCRPRWSRATSSAPRSLLFGQLQLHAPPPSPTASSRHGRTIGRSACRRRLAARGRSPRPSSRAAEVIALRCGQAAEQRPPPRD
jgi:hypothetical protein